MRKPKQTITIQTADPNMFYGLIEALDAWGKEQAATQDDSTWVLDLRDAWQQFQKNDSVDFITRAGFGEYRPDGDPQETLNALLSAAGAARDPKEALWYAKAAKMSVECFYAIEMIQKSKAARQAQGAADPAGDAA